jgi:hypothetical protein
MSFGFGASAFGAGGDASIMERGAASGRGFLSLGTESGKGLRIFITCGAPAAVDTKGVGNSGAGEADRVEGAGLAGTAGEALGAGDGLGAGEELFVEDDLERLTTEAGFGGKLKISSTFCDETLNLTILLGRSSWCGVSSCGRGRLGGIMTPAPVPAPLKDNRTGWAAGFGGGGGRAFGTRGSFTEIALDGFVRRLFASLKLTIPCLC